jgi:hypothetical protein
MEQVEGGDLVVHRGGDKPKPAPDAPREMHIVDGLASASALAHAEVAALQKAHPAPAEPSSAEEPETVSHTHIFVRVQPFRTAEQRLQFLVVLADPGHELAHDTITQAIPEAWLALWDKYDWVEDQVVAALRQAVEVVGQDYIARRMGWIAAPAKDGEEAEEEEEDDDEEESGEESE